MYVIIVKSLSSFNVRNFVLFVNFKQGMKIFFWRKSIFGRVDCITPTCTLTNYRYHSFTPFTFFSKPIWDNQSRFTHKPFFFKLHLPLALSLSSIIFPLSEIVTFWHILNVWLSMFISGISCLNKIVVCRCLQEYHMSS